MYLDKLFISSVLLGSSLMANTAESVYLNSARFLSFDNLKFTVKSVTKTPSTTSSRSFLVAKTTDGEDTSLLMRFEEPSDIRCTAVLLNKEKESTSNYLYLPSLKRTRMIPQSKKGSEVFGMGISYSELNGESGDFAPLEEYMEDGIKYYKVTKLSDPVKSVYNINSVTSEVKSIIVYKNNTLEKEIIMDKIIDVEKIRLITKWRIKDLKKDRVITYTIDEDSVSSKVKSSLFRKNRLDRCVF